MEPDFIIDFASVADALDVHVHLNVLQLLPERHEQPARNAQPVQFAQTGCHFADVRPSGFAGLPDDGFQRVVEKMRIDLAHEDLHFQLLLPALHLHLLVQPHPDAVQHGIVGGHHPRDLLRALRLCIGVQIPGVCVPHGFFQLGHRDHEPPVEVQDQQRKHPAADRQNEDRLEIQLRGRGGQAIGRSQKHRCPRG